MRVPGLQWSMITAPQATGLVALAERIELWPIDRLRRSVFGIDGEKLLRAANPAQRISAERDQPGTFLLG
jgi:hypothetical protein